MLGYAVRSRRRMRSPHLAARARLRSFRQATLLTVALTSILLLLFDPQESGVAQEGAEVAADSAEVAAEVPDTVAVIQQIPLEELQEADDTAVADTPEEAAAEAAGTLRGLWKGLVANLPKYAITLGILAIAWALVRLLRRFLPWALGRWQRVDAITALSGVVLWMLAFGIAMSVLVGDVRALVGSVGLVGLALSWALQTPIESFTGWLLNSFRGYYRVGDRIAVGDVFGDVYRIDFLTTTVWEYGGADRRGGHVHAEQPTGRMITFPNSEVLAGSVVNYTRDFPFVWDELQLLVTSDSDVRHAAAVAEDVARLLLGEYMAEPARIYELILRDARLETAVPAEPQVFVTVSPGWTTLTIRYLVGARERRRWRSELSLQLLEAFAEPENRERVELLRALAPQPPSK